MSAGIMLYGFLIAADLASSSENGSQQGINVGCRLAGITHQTKCSQFNVAETAHKATRDLHLIVFIFKFPQQDISFISLFKNNLLRGL